MHNYCRYIYTILISTLLSAATVSLPAQEKLNTHYPKNTIDIQALGNKGFIAIGYNRALFQSGRFALLLGPAIGFVPGSHEDTTNTIPTFFHMNLGANAGYRVHLFEASVGLSYSRILLSDKYNARPKPNYNRVLGDISYIQHFKTGDISIKISFTPILFDDGADDVQNIPVGFTFRVGL